MSGFFTWFVDELVFYVEEEFEVYEDPCWLFESVGDEEPEEVEEVPLLVYESVLDEELGFEEVLLLEPEDDVEFDEDPPFYFYSSSYFLCSTA